MHFSWNRQTIEWFKQASMYTGFHSQLADKLRPLVAGSKSMYDMGCGLALLSQQLSDSIESIVGVDMNEAALASLQQDTERLGLTNIRPVLGDCFAEGPTCDVILLSYFGSSSLDRFLPRCRKLISIVDLDERSSLAGNQLKGVERKRQTAGRVEEQLQAKGIAYTMEEIALEFGQPFLTAEEASRFFQQYYRCSPKEAEAFMAERLREAEQEPYLYYLPYLKRMGIFVVEGSCA